MSPTDGVIPDENDEVVNASEQHEVMDPNSPAPGEMPMAPDNRPPQNVLGEVNRKYTKIERQQQEQNQQIAEILNLMRAQQRPVAQVQQAGSEYSDEQLAAMDAGGNMEAKRLLTERIVRRETESRMNAWTQQQAVQNAVAQLMGKYPQLHDQQDPLTQAVFQARQTFINSGWQMGPNTDLESIKAAILNAPHLVKQPSAPTPDLTRRSAVTAQQSMDGSSPRRSPQQGRAQGPALTPRQQELAKRYGVKDPQGAIKRFADRRAAGTSVLNPNLESTVREQENA